MHLNFKKMFYIKPYAVYFLGLWSEKLDFEHLNTLRLPTFIISSFVHEEKIKYENRTLLNLYNKIKKCVLQFRSFRFWAM